ncbi:hypothetical protein ABC195_06660 [Microbacterium sp. 2P01SA-2]|uniref:hypothetical protein n=1 Tax=unclassified Microbacterium TaxID=2609290 RepID=UPI0039A0921C
MTEHHDNEAEHADEHAHGGAQHAPDETPSTEELEEPSVAKEPGEEPKAPETKDEEPSHHAVGIGVIDDESSPLAP